MSGKISEFDAQEIRKLIPLNVLSATRFESLCSLLEVEISEKGVKLFESGETKSEFIYLLEGSVSLHAGDLEIETIRGGTDAARFALAHQIPRKVTAIVQERVRVIRVNTNEVSQASLNVSSGVASYEVSDEAEIAGDDWMATLLMSPIFQRLPPRNLQNILTTLEEIPVRKGQEVIQQDDWGDFYYVIKRGYCLLTRQLPRLARVIKLAELKPGDTFGEDSLISNQPRNVTVTMMTDGALLRLSKTDFLQLVKEPTIEYVNLESATRFIEKGAIWLDMRSEEAFGEGHLPQAINIPFFKLRMALTSLKKKKKYLLVCEDGRISEAAAFLLIGQGIDARVLKGGIALVFKDQLVKFESDCVAFKPVLDGATAVLQSFGVSVDSQNPTETSAETGEHPHVATPTMIESWHKGDRLVQEIKRLTKINALLERDKRIAEQRIRELESQVDRLTSALHPALKEEGEPTQNGVPDTPAA